MDFKVIITQSATEDLATIVAFIAQDNPAAALRFGEAVLKKFQELGRFPFLGRVVPERGDPDWREIPYKSYRLIYHVSERESTVEAGRVWHSARGEPEF